MKGEKVSPVASGDVVVDDVIDLLEHSSPEVVGSADVGAAQDESSCGICFEPRREDTGELPDCNHAFCFTCIGEWAKCSTTCPLCRASFTCIRRLRCVAGEAPELRNTVDVEQRTLGVTTEDEDLAGLLDDDNYSCSICNLDTDEQVLLLCDGCDRCMHTYCCGLSSVPTGDWYCPTCADSPQIAQRSSSRRRTERRATSINESIEEAPARRANTVSASHHSIVQAAARAQRRATRNARRGRRSASSRGVVQPTPSRPIDLNSFGDLQNRAEVFRSNWEALRSGMAVSDLSNVGMRVRGQSGRGAASVPPSPPAAHRPDGQSNLWALAEQARRSLAIRTARDDRVETNQQRSAALQLIRRRMQQQREAQRQRQGGHDVQNPAGATSLRRPPPRRSFPETHPRCVPHHLARHPPETTTEYQTMGRGRPAPARPPLTAHSSWAGHTRAPRPLSPASIRDQRERAIAGPPPSSAPCRSAAHPSPCGAAQARGVATSPPARTYDCNGRKRSREEEEERHAAGGPISMRSKHDGEAGRDIGAAQARGGRASALTRVCESDARKRPRDEERHVAIGPKAMKSGGGGDASCSGHAERGGTGGVGWIKDAACRAVKEYIKPKYAAHQMSKEQFKAVAKSATRALVESRQWRRSKGGSTGSREGGTLVFPPSAVQRAVEESMKGGR